LAHKVIKTDQEWKDQLTELSYDVLRKHGTERAFSCDNFSKIEGSFLCAGCETTLFESKTKFDSKSGWPSFYQPINSSVVKETTDTNFLMKRTEVSCSICDGHLGHVFPDGPIPTGLRYCINGSALNFKKSVKG